MQTVAHTVHGQSMSLNNPATRRPSLFPKAKSTNEQTVEGVAM